LCQRFEIRSYVRKLGQNATTAQKLELTKSRRKLRKRITSFSRTAVDYLGEEANDSIYEIELVVLDEDVSEDEDTIDADNPTITAADPESQVLPFPSAVPERFLARLPADSRAAIVSLQNIELRIREGHADDSLEQVRTAVIHLSWQFKNKVRKAKSVVQNTRAWDNIKLLNRSWKLHRRVYNHNRFVMMNLGDRTTVARLYPELELKDCDASTTVTNPNSAGQSSDRLSWIWSASRAEQASENEEEYQNECKVPLLAVFSN